MSWVRVVGVGVSVGCLAACNALLGLDPYRACEGAECSDAGSSIDGSSDTGADAPGLACTTSTDCVDAQAGILCDQGRCVAVKKVAPGISNHACVVLTNGTARCWGRNAEGQLGNGKTSPTNVATPVRVLDVDGVTPMTGIQDMSLGFDFSCAVRLVAGNTSVWCWGMGAGGGISTSRTQVDFQGAAVVQLSAGSNSACALTSTGGSGNDAFCWGSNVNGQMTCDNGVTTCGQDAGVASPDPVSLQVPRHVAPITKPTIIADGLYAMCTTYQTSGFVDCYGTDPWGNLGDNQTLSNSCCLKAHVGLPASLVKIVASDNYVCAQDNTLAWYCWGGNSPPLGCPALNGCVDLHQPTPLAIGSSILTLAAGWRHACGVTAGGVKCWGQNDHGQIGNGTTKPINQGPVTFATKTTISAVNDIAAHRHFTCALGADEKIYCWGQNGDQNDPTPWLLGVGSTPGDVTTPQPVVWE